ncbi:MAG: DUF1573 domain-containing protein [Chitinophagales bacterium]
MTTILFFTQCKPDSKDEAKEETTIENTDASAESTQPEVLTPEDIAKQKIEGLPTTTVEWVNTEHDFGDIKKNEKVSTTFKFKNTGDNPLIIAEAKAGCGCTVPSKPDEPVQPGETGEIKVEYNGSGNGKVTKFVNVILNTESQAEKLTITTNVLAEEGQ